ncbi:hypothetical protein GCM10022393_42630 [Aquimarina addita]|uniref:Uncharacterized protein n=1 Tax=Aquimarina addita TaxID=870485 RepID=A0ABP6UZD6_9FLAO
MEFFDDIFAGWSFELGKEVSKKNFTQLLTILDASGILKINTIAINITNQPFHSIDRTSELFIECFEEGMNLSLSGTTAIQTESDNKMFDEAISFLYEPKLSLISIDTYTDAWMPIGYLNETLQVDCGVANSKKLKGVLKQISRLSFIKKIDPAEEEYFHDYMVHQIGFSLFYKRNIENIKGLVDSDYGKVAPFILSS